MNRLIIKRLKISIDTEEGLFGTDITFQTGFNILRADNTKGKSTTLNAILFALGLEELLGGRNAKTMKHVLKDKLNYKDKEIPVLESKVQLEISNDKDEILTITRWIKSKSIDEKLIRVHFGAIISTQNNYIHKDFYVHMKGAAVENAGFHGFLSTYFNWNLPLVPTFDGGDRLLYLQTLFPFIFIEQNKGWSSFYNPVSGSFGIRDLSKRAFEFFLNLDITRNAKEREELKVIKALLSNKWSSLKGELEELAKSINGEILDLPVKPTLLDEISLNVFDDGRKPVKIVDRIFQIERLIKEKEKIKLKRISEVTQKYEDKVKEQELVVMSLQNEKNLVLQDLQLELKNDQTMNQNLINLEEDLKKNQEAEKLYKLGSEIDNTITQGVCPICHHPVEDTLMPPESSIQPLDLSTNIFFIKEQISTVKFGIKQSEKIIQNKQIKLGLINEHLDNSRRELRLFKSELVETPTLPTKQEIEKLVELKILLHKLHEASLSFEKIEKRFGNIKIEWKDYLKRHQKLPKDYFSELDKKKLKFFEKQFLSLLTKFNFSSTNIPEITISNDKYTPTVSGIDIKFDSSASDNIRLIWSYSIALYKTSIMFSGNHLGILVFDEPGQQQMATQSQEELFKVLSKEKGQSLIGTSLKQDEIIEMTKDLKVNIIDLGDSYIIQPLD